MMTTLEKIKRLEQYLAVDHTSFDPVLDMTIEKLMRRELKRVLDLKARLSEQIAEFENRYSLRSVQFYPKYERGELGDDLDFMEWAATLEMVANLNQQVTLLEIEPVQ
jgi:hypothetical protein